MTSSGGPAFFAAALFARRTKTSTKPLPNPHIRKPCLIPNASTVSASCFNTQKPTGAGPSFGQNAPSTREFRELDAKTSAASEIAARTHGSPGASVSSHAAWIEEDALSQNMTAFSYRAWSRRIHAYAMPSSRALNARIETRKTSSCSSSFSSLDTRRRHRTSRRAFPVNPALVSSSVSLSLSTSKSPSATRADSPVLRRVSARWA
mmetsp:Transcript_3151/g.11028  ORF Transcript_3151/g.11028 Transcript_3151/m.11028 type:complete len:206 (-) Transcript_3151:247-864(-)